MTDVHSSEDALPETSVQEIPVLGIPVRFETNDVRVAGIIERAFRPWLSILHRPDLLSSHRVSFTIAVDPSADGADDEGTIRYHMPDYDRVVVTTERSVGMSDAARGDAIVRASNSLVADEERFRYAFLEALTLALLTRFDRQPFHASAIAQDGVALLLAGPSGVGKSTIAYTAVRGGLQILAEDAVYTQLEPHLRIWGTPQPLRLQCDAKAYFPELADERLRRQPNGKLKITIDLAGNERVLTVERAGLCVLVRRAGPTAVERIDPDEVLAELSTPREPGFSVFASTIPERLARIATCGCWRLNLSGDPNDALPYLRQMLVEVAQ